MSGNDATVPPGIGPYRPLAILGKGGMGVVYRAVDSHGREVALKTVLPHYQHDQRYVGQFKKEIGNALRVSSPFIPDVLDSGVDPANGLPYYVIELVEGTTPEAHLRLGPLDNASLHLLATNLIGAIVALNDVGLIHRDIKPANIIMASTSAFRRWTRV